MTASEVLTDEHVQKCTTTVTECIQSNSIKVVHTQYFYKTNLYDNQYSFKFFNSSLNSILDYTNTPISFKQQDKLAIDKSTIRYFDISDLTIEQLHDILDKNISYFTKLKLKKKQIELINYIN